MCLRCAHGVVWFPVVIRTLKLSRAWRTPRDVWPDHVCCDYILLLCHLVSVDIFVSSVIFEVPLGFLSFSYPSISVIDTVVIVLKHVQQLWWLTVGVLLFWLVDENLPRYSLSHCQALCNYDTFRLRGNVSNVWCRSNYFRGLFSFEDRDYIPRLTNIYVKF